MKHITFTDIFDAELLPCPMCGAAPARTRNEAAAGGVFMQEKLVPVAERDFFNSGDIRTVRCCGCGLNISRATREAAVEAWNRRTNV